MGFKSFLERRKKEKATTRILCIQQNHTRQQVSPPDELDKAHDARNSQQPKDLKNADDPSIACAALPSPSGDANL